MSLVTGIAPSVPAALAPGFVEAKRAYPLHAPDVSPDPARGMPRPGSGHAWRSTRLNRLGLAGVVAAHVLALSGIALSRPAPRHEPEKTLSATLILPEIAPEARPAAPAPKALPEVRHIPRVEAPAVEPPPTKPVAEPPPPRVEPPRPVEPPPLAAIETRPRPMPQASVVPAPVAPPAPAQPVTPAKAEPVATPVPAAPARVDDEPAPPRAAPAALPGKPDDVKRYVAALMRQLNRHKVYPPELKKARTEGRVVLRFTLDKSGRLVASSVKQSSGHPELDRAALEMLTRASPLPAIPEFMARDQLALAIPVEYSLITDR